jgi:protein-L-isoaspartate(D-aspartate) O-methyltransferase
VIPVGNQYEQALVRIIKRQDGSISCENSIGCRFVKLIGKFGWSAED